MNNNETKICGICAEVPKKYRWITCPYCKFTCCERCVQTYLLGKKNIEAECMSCRKTWNYEFLTESMSHNFYNDTYRRHTAEVLMQREKSLLPTTQELARKEKKRRRKKENMDKYIAKHNILLMQIKQLKVKARGNHHIEIENKYKKELDRIKELYNLVKKGIIDGKNNQISRYMEERKGKNKAEKNEIDQAIRKIKENSDNKIELNMKSYLQNQRKVEKEYKKDIKEYLEILKVCERKERELKDKFREFKANMNRPVWKDPIKEMPKYSYRAPCPQNTCNGYVDEKWNCGMCKVKVCAQCHKIKYTKKDKNYKGPHVCNKDDVATIKLLSKDTKNCPKCSVLIHKIDGCDQMWCTECYTAFDWVSGEICKGIIHNPHYFEYKRQAAENGIIPRNPLDVRCGGMPEPYVLRHHLTYNIKDIPKSIIEQTCEIIRVIHHIRDVVIPKYPIIDGAMDHLDLRVKFLIKDIDEKKWQWHLKKRNKKKQKDEMINNALSMYTDTASSIISNLMQLTDSEKVTDSIKELTMLQSYVLKEMKKIEYKFKNMVPINSIDDFYNVNNLFRMRVIEAPEW